MKKSLILSIAITNLIGCTAHLDELKTESSQAVNVNNFKTICIFDYTPNIKYESIKNYRSGSNFFGSVSSVMPKFLDYADRLNGNAIINYSGGQHFGFWPWRLVRPIVSGTAINWPNKNNKSCKELGGRIYAIKSNRKVFDITNQI